MKRKRQNAAAPTILNYLERRQVAEQFRYHKPTMAQIASLAVVRQQAHVLALTILRHCPVSADRAAALRRLREAVMTANASIVIPL